MTRFVTGDWVAGRYRVLGRLGEGGAAWAYEAHDSVHDRRVTLKVLRRESARSILTREFHRLRDLRYPRLPTVRDLGVDVRHRGGTVTYYVADFVDGEPLTRRRGIDGDVVLGDVLEALAFLHERGIRHGDVSPANILVTPEGRGVLIDLGCASPLGHEGGTGSRTTRTSERSEARSVIGGGTRGDSLPVGGGLGLDLPKKACSRTTRTYDPREARRDLGGGTRGE
ncbi:MAG: hypothetical protein AAGE52_39945, partial [Myxococcota bacterium]